MNQDYEVRKRRGGGGYQGPGIYRVFTGVEYKVLGRIGMDGDIIMSRDGKGDHLYAEKWNEFNRMQEGGFPTWIYLRDQ